MKIFWILAILTANYTDGKKSDEQMSYRVFESSGAALDEGLRQLSPGPGLPYLSLHDYSSKIKSMEVIAAVLGRHYAVESKLVPK